MVDAGRRPLGQQVPRRQPAEADGTAGQQPAAIG
jgi:hypothetical protein